MHSESEANSTENDEADYVEGDDCRFYQQHKQTGNQASYCLCSSPFSGAAYLPRCHDPGNRPVEAGHRGEHGECHPARATHGRSGSFRYENYERRSDPRHEGHGRLAIWLALAAIVKPISGMHVVRIPIAVAG